MTSWSRPSAPPRRAVATRGGALPVLSGVRVELTGDQLHADRQRPRPDHPGRGRRSAGDERRRGRAAGPAGRRHRAGARAGRGARRGRRRRGPDHRRAARSSRCALLPAEEFPRLRRAGRATRSPSTPPTLAEALRQVVPAASTRRRPARSSPACSWRPRATACAWWPPTRTAWPCATCPGTTRAAPRARRVLVPSRALGELARRAGRRRAGHAAPRRARRDLRGRATSGSRTRLIEGEFPNYRQLIPSSHPNRLTVGREPLLDAVRRVKLLAREATPVRLALQRRRPRAHGDHPGRRPGPRGPRRQVRGHRADRGVQPRVPARRASRRSPATRSRSRRSTPSSRRSLRSAEGADFLYLLMPVRVS